MDRIIKWFNDDNEVYLTVTDNNIFRCTTVLDIDNISVTGDLVNIMAGDIDLWINANEFSVIPGGILYINNNVEISLTI